VLNDMHPELLPAGSPLVAVRWQLKGVEQSLEGFSRVDRANSVEELRAVAAGIAAPIQTFTAADVDGHIGTFVCGTVPIRRAHRGTFPIPGWLAKYEWDGVLAPADLPGGLDPAAGFYAHANNLMVDPRETATPLNIDAAPPYRYQRIVDRLGAVEKHTLASLASIQSDVKLGRAARVLPRMLEDLAGFAPRSPKDTEALAELTRWDYEAKADSPAAAIFFVTYRHAVLEAVSDELSLPARDFFMSQRYSTNVADGWFDKADHPVWGKAGAAATRTTVVRAAFARAVDELSASQGAVAAQWRWGKLHYVEPKHAFGGQSALAGMVNLERTEAGGALDSVWKSHFEMGDEKHPFRAMAGPVYRMAIDLADVAHARWVVDTGASGWPGSPHYGDQFQLWRKGELAPMTYDAAELKRDATAVLTLKP
jgi:penicillin amidase